MPSPDVVSASEVCISDLLVGQDAWLLTHVADRSLEKLELIGFDLAREELLPYLPPGERDQVTQSRWIDMTLAVGQALESWARLAMERQCGTEPPPSGPGGPP